MVKEAIKRKDTARVRLELENNIHTEFRANVKIVNVETGISEESFSLNASYTGGNRDASLEKVLSILSSQVRRKLKELYMITSEVFEVDGAYLNMLSGENLGLKKGTMFEIASKNRIKSYKGKTIKLPGKTRGLVKIIDVGPEGSKARIVRKWRKIKEGHKAYFSFTCRSPGTILQLQLATDMKCQEKHGLILSVSSLRVLITI